MKIDVCDLTRHFGRTKAVDGISFSLESGHIFGFVGPNGAGKTTTLRIMATLDDPTSGDVMIDGHSVIQYPERVRRLLGFMPDSLPAHSDINVMEYLDFFARGYGLRGATRTRALASVVEFTNLGNLRHKLLRSLSKGMKQRVSLARALVHDPAILIMDEPAAGLDPRARVEFRELVSLLAENGKAILISSHILTELTEICNGVVIIERGKILRTGTLDDVMRTEVAHRTLAIRAVQDAEAVHRTLLEMPHVMQARIVGKEVHVDLEGDESQAAELLAALVQGELQVCEFRPVQDDLEDLFMRVTRGDVA